VQLLERFRRPGTLLDLGCGPGYLVKAAEAMGWRAAGCDISEGCCEFGRRMLGVQLFAGSFEDLPERSGIYHPDAITAFHVLEHLHEPDELLQFAAHALLPGGILVIEVPNLFSFESLCAGDSWHGLALPAHVAFYTPESLKLLFEPSFRVAKLEYSIAPYFYERIESYAKQIAVSPEIIDRCARQFSGTAMVAYLERQPGTRRSDEGEEEIPSLVRRGARRITRLLGRP
jgi:SAM-dependent methyltransferase